MSEREDERYGRMKFEAAGHLPTPSRREEGDRIQRLQDLERELDGQARECRKVFRDLDQACDAFDGAMRRVQASATSSVLLAVAAGFLAVAGALLAWVLH